MPQIRHRKKNIYNAIRQQMEFYFGDANLSKDRFLMQLIKENPYVPLDVFLTFNKMKKLVNNVEDIAKSLTNSTLLKLSSDGLRVSRTTELPPPDRNADECILYAEGLPPDATHDWMTKVFSRFGSVAYVSLPKFKNSQKIKEFCFIEFDKAESIEKALNFFKTFNGLLDSEKMDPNQLISVKTYEGGEKNDNIVEHKINLKKRCLSPTEINLKKDEDISTLPPLKRTKIFTKAVSESEVKLETDEEKVFPMEETFVNDDAKSLPISSSDSSSIESENERNDVEDDNNLENKKKKRRKHKKKILSAPINPLDDGNIENLRILPKKQWKRLRNKYLNMQREKVSAIKRQMYKNRLNNNCNTDNVTKPSSSSTESKKSSPHPVSIKYAPNNINFYGANQQDDTTPPVSPSTISNKQLTPDSSTGINKNNVKLVKKPLFEYRPGIIVHIKLSNPCVNVKDFKSELRQYPYVCYVDVTEGSFDAYVRCGNAKNSENLVTAYSSAEYKCQVLSEDLEQQYWNKIMNDREMKLNKTIKLTNKKRGREKVAQVVSKHIRFNDDEQH